MIFYELLRIDRWVEKEMELFMKITNYEIYKLKKSGLTNQQVLAVLEYGENVDQELLLVKPDFFNL